MSSPPLDPDRSIVAIVEAAASSSPRVDGRGPGRPKGQPNRATATMRFLLEQAMQNQLLNIDKALSGILFGIPVMRDADTGALVTPGVAPNPTAWVKAVTDIADFCLPRLTRVEVKDDRAPLASVEIPDGATQEQAAQAYLTMLKT